MSVIFLLIEAFATVCGEPVQVTEAVSAGTAVALSALSVHTCNVARPEPGAVELFTVAVIAFFVVPL